MHPYLVNGLEFGPLCFERVYAKISPDRFDEASSEDRFTLREAMAHLADWESIFRGRMERVQQEPGIVIHGEDESVRAEQNRYSEQDVAANLAKFKDERAKTVAFVKSLEPSDWRKSCKRPEYYDMTIEDIANLLLGHDLYHLEHATLYL